jgi:hypothetical protein
MVTFNYYIIYFYLFPSLSVLFATPSSLRIVKHEKMFNILNKKKSDFPTTANASDIILYENIKSKNSKKRARSKKMSYFYT